MVELEVTDGLTVGVVDGDVVVVAQDGDVVVAVAVVEADSDGADQ